MRTETTTRSVGFPLNDLADRLALLRRERRDRRAIAKLAKLEPHRLDDMGITRGDVYRAVAQPLSVDAANSLYRATLNRKRAR